MKGKTQPPMKNIVLDAISEFGSDNVRLLKPSFDDPIYHVKTEHYENTNTQVITVYKKSIEKPYQVPFMIKDRNGLIKRDDLGNPLWYDPKPSRGNRKGRMTSDSVKLQELSDKSANGRARRTLERMVLANVWDFWVTLTFDPKKHPYCTDLVQTKRVLEKWFNNFQQRQAPSLKKILVYELMTENLPHKWHAHLFMSGVDSFMIRTRHTHFKTGRAIYNFLPWSEQFGFTKCVDIRGASAKERLSIARYLSGYLDKYNEDKVPHKKRFQASRGLSRKPETLYEYNPQPLEDYFSNPALLYHHKYPIRNEEGVIINYAYVFTANEENETSPIVE